VTGIGASGAWSQWPKQGLPLQGRGFESALPHTTATCRSTFRLSAAFSFHAARPADTIRRQMRSDVLALINTDHLLHNYRALRARLRPGVKLCAPLKANAYGHGLAVVAPVLQQAGADCAAVATVQEAIELREVGWHRPILVLGHVLAIGSEAERRERLEAIDEHGLAVTVADGEVIRQLELWRGGPIDVHVKVDTGMGRMGALPDEIRPLVTRVLGAPHLRLAGVYSHFATADFQQPDLARRQLETFLATLGRLADILPRRILRHLANSAATITLPDAHFDMVRPGLALYGYLPAPHMAEQISLRPILRLVSHVSLVKHLPAGHCVGYGQTFTTSRPTRLGIVPIGYFDGYLRGLSNLAVVGTCWGDAPVVGRVSMDQMAVDLTEVPQAGIGAAVTVISDRPGSVNSVAAIAERLGTISYEVTCLLGSRIDRVAIGSSCAEAVSPAITKPRVRVDPMSRTREHHTLEG